MPDITMPHSCEVTSRRIDVAIRNHRDQLMPGEIATLVKAAEILGRIAREDRERMASNPPFLGDGSPNPSRG